MAQKAVTISYAKRYNRFRSSFCIMDNSNWSLLLQYRHSRDSLKVLETNHQIPIMRILIILYFEYSILGAISYCVCGTKSQYRQQLE